MAQLKLVVGDIEVHLENCGEDDQYIVFYDTSGENSIWFPVEGWSDIEPFIKSEIAKIPKKNQVLIRDTQEVLPFARNSYDHYTRENQ